MRHNPHHRSGTDVGGIMTKTQLETIRYMEIHFKDSKLEKYAKNERLCVRKLGKEQAEKYLKRIDQLYNAETLEDTRYLPGHYHELTEDRKGQWGCDLVQPDRLVFEPYEQPIPTSEDGGYIWEGIKEINIIEIINYHGK